MSPGGPEARPPGTVAELDGAAIGLDEIDAPVRDRVERLRAALVALAEATLRDRVDARLRAEVDPPVPEPVSAEAVEAYRQAHIHDFAGPRAPTGGAGDPAVQRAAIRFLLEAEAREAAERRQLERLRSAHVVRFEVPDARSLEQALAPDRVVAWIDDRPIPAAELETAAALRLYRLRGELYRERSRQLEGLVERRLLEAEARRRGITREALEQTLAPDLEKVSAEELAEHRAQRARAGEPAPLPERARPYLAFRKAHAHRRALLEQLRRDAELQILLQAPPEPRLPMGAAGEAVLGPGTGPRLVAFLDYRCDACRTGHAAIDRLREQAPELRVELRDFVPVYDPGALEAARLARCAARLGKLAELRRLLLQREAPAYGVAWYREEEIPGLAARIDVDAAALAACLDAPDADRATQRDTAEALALGFAQAPAYVAEGVPLSGLQSADGIAQALRRGRLAR